MDTNQKAFADLCSMFTQRMDAFEGELKNATPCNSLSSLAADFVSFKTFFIKSLKAVQEQMRMLSRSVDNLEMRSRRKILLLHGVPEEKQENTATVVKDVVQAKMKFDDFKVEHISRCHRMGKPSESKPRPILFKLTDMTMRSKIWMAKSKLKGTGFTVSEFLTKHRHDLFMRARQEFGISKCWTRDGTIIVLSAEGIRHSISTAEDINEILTSNNVAMPAPSAKEQSKTRRGAGKKQA